jgi:general secretion pathway protein J
MMCKSQTGMTLLEVLVALAIFVLIAAAGYSGLQQGLAVQEGLQVQQLYWQRLDGVLNLIQQDLDQARDQAPRVPVWNALAFRGFGGSMDPGEDGELLLFTRSAQTYYVTEQASPVMRIAYWIEDGILHRRTWPRLNGQESDRGADAILLERVSSVQLRYLDGTRQWSQRWPQPLLTGVEAGIPKAVELTLQLDDEISFQRVFHVGAAF